MTRNRNALPAAASGRSCTTTLESLERRVLLSTTPNDEYYDDLWGLRAVGADQAWDTTTGSATTVAANIDTGIDYTHPDLYQNIWINPTEIPKSLQGRLRDTDGDGVISFVDLNHRRNSTYVDDLNGNGYIDAGDLLAPRNADGSGGWENGDDGGGNGYIDDIIGWDFANNDNDPLDTVGHGTHTAGTIGATGNNGIGVAGVAWDVALMAVKIFDDAGNSAANDAIAAAIRYAVDAGARVSNNSWGGSGGAGADIYDAIRYANDRGHIFVTAAGNSGVNNDRSFWRSYPASFDLPNVISVAASTEYGGLAYFSNYGAATVDLVAPGTNILSTWPGGNYAFASGTSMAAPHVTGTIALMLSQNPGLSVGEVESALTSGADQSRRLIYATRSGGELNTRNAVTGVTGVRFNPAPPGSSGTGTATPITVIIFGNPDGDVLIGHRHGAGVVFA